MDSGLRFLIIRSGGLGDSILTLPVAARLRELYPDAGLHVLGNGNMLAAARLTGLFEGFRSLDEAGFSALFAGNGPTPFLRAYLSRFDRVYCFTAGNGAAVARTVLDSGARSCSPLDPRPPRGWTEHITAHFLSILGPEGIGPAVLPAPVSPTRSPRNDLLVIHPGSGGIPKTWPLGRFVEVAGRWPGETVFLLGPAELDRGCGERIPGRFHRVCDPSLSEAGALLASAAAYVGNDSGASHLAAMCGTPAIALFGPTDPRVWRPLGGHVRVIVSADGSMEEIGVEEVARRCIQLFQTGKGA